MSYLPRVSAVVLLMSCVNYPTTAKDGAHIQLNLPEGYRYEAITAIETMCLTDVSPADRLNYRTERLITFLCRVMEKRADGDMRIEFQYQRIREVYYDIGGYPHPCDTNDPNIENDPRRESYRERALSALRGRTFVAVVTAAGEVRRIEGFPRLYNDLHRALAFRWTGPGKIKIADEKLFTRQMEDHSEETFKKFFGGYWPLSEDSLKETVQQLFLIWPKEAIDTGASWHTTDALPALTLRRTNSWTLRDERADGVVVELISDVRTDLNLCDPNVPEAHRTNDNDFLDDACHRYQRVEQVPMYAGERNGCFTADTKSGLIQHATWTEELLGICPLKDPAKGRPEPFACPSKRTQTVAIEITPVSATSPSD